MALRFRRTFKLAPGVRLNLSGRGASFTLGPRGASINFGSRGTFFNASIAGTGLSTRLRLDTPAAKPRPSTVETDVRIRVEEDGTLAFLDESGAPVPDYLANLTKRRSGAQIREFLEATAHRINSEREAFGTIHLHTPPSTAAPTRTKRQFEKLPPPRPMRRVPGFLDWLFRRRAQIEAENQECLRAFEKESARWEAMKKMFEKREELACQKFDFSLRSETKVMEETLEKALLDIVWPRETLVSFEIRDNGTSIDIEVDLPEIEDLPRKVAAVPERSYKLSVKDLKGRALQEHYANHVHGIGFRILGEVFATLPTVSIATLSAFTQRDDPTTGHTRDTYIYSVRVRRTEWSRINFSNLVALDVVSVFEQFELQRKEARNGVYQEVVPLDA